MTAATRAITGLMAELAPVYWAAAVAEVLLVMPAVVGLDEVATLLAEPTVPVAWAGAVPFPVAYGATALAWLVAWLVGRPAEE
jgi:hypothetical protein